jgi:hypothetical protein
MTDSIECSGCVAGPPLVSLKSLVSLRETLNLFLGVAGAGAADKLRGQEVRDAQKAPASAKNVGPTAKQSTQSDKRRAERVGSSARATSTSNRQRGEQAGCPAYAKGRAR